MLLQHTISYELMTALQITFANFVPTQCGVLARNWIRLVFHDCGTYNKFTWVTCKIASASAVERLHAVMWMQICHLALSQRLEPSSLPLRLPFTYPAAPTLALMSATLPQQLQPLQYPFLSPHPVRSLGRDCSVQAQVWVRRQHPV